MKLALLFSLLALGALGLLARGGGIDDEATAASETETTRENKVKQDPDTTRAAHAPEREIARIGNQWAPLFAAGDRAACKLMTEPACERIICESVGGRTTRNCTPLSPDFRKSFADATVRSVAIRGDHLANKDDEAAAKFSNGEAVKLEADGTGWLIMAGIKTAGRFYRAVAHGADPVSKFCGGFQSPPYGPPLGLIKVEVVEGDVPCRVASRVLKRLYGKGLPPHTDSWSCHGPEGIRECYEKPGKTIRAHVRGYRSWAPLSR